MGNNLRFHIGDTTDTTAKVAYSTLVDSAVSLSISSGSVSDSGRTDQHGGTYIGTGVFTITGLSADTKYTFTISQGAESYTGSFWTARASGKKFSFIMQTCTYHAEKGPLVYRDMRDVVTEYESTAPVVYQFDIDDQFYADLIHATGNDVLPQQTNQPQLSGLASDYAISWAIWHGHETEYSNFTDPDYQWILRNIASGKTPGDHAVEGNHCRGEVGNPDYLGCDRTLEATAMGVYDAFIGNANPPKLGASGHYWNKQIGPIRFVGTDEFSFADPNDGTNQNEARATHPMLGDQQITDIDGYIDTDTVPLKCLLMPTGFSIAGQPWNEWWSDEAKYFHENVLNSANLNGTNGWFFGLVGDNHTLHTIRFNGGTGTGFWTFCPGTTGSSTVTSANPSDNTYSFNTKTGGAAYFRNGLPGNTNDENGNFGSFLHVIVHADESPVRIECRAIETGGNEVFRYQLVCESGNDNQWTNVRSMRVAI